MKRPISVGVFLLILFGVTMGWSQSTSTIRGTVTDSSGAVLPKAEVTLRQAGTNLERTGQTDSSGIYQFTALPIGDYRIEVRASGFRTALREQVHLNVNDIAQVDFSLQVGEMSQTVTVESAAPIVETNTITVGHVVNEFTVQQIPLNGRHFVDLGLLIPGSVTPPQNGFLTAPLRGQGSFAFNTAGNREDTVNFMINGINLNDQVQNQITFQPSINTVQEFKVDNSTYSAEFGRSSGAIVNIATRSGTNDFHGEAFEFLRNDALDARNFFNTPPAVKAPFKRNQFGAALGGPVWKDHTFFFFSYEGLRQRQGLTINSPVLTDANRANAQAINNPTVVKLLALIPNANSAPVGGQLTRFVGSATAPVDIDQWTVDLSHNIGRDDRLHGYYAIQRDKRQEPTLQGNTIPDFGDTRQSRRQIFTLNETHIFGPNLTNEARLGFNRIHITFTPNAQLNPADFSINDGITTPLGLPQIAVNIAGINLNFGGPAGFPQGRGDTTGAFSDTLSWQRGRHWFKFGGEVRRFYNNNFNQDIGSFTFSNVDNFINGRANAFRITLGNGASRIVQGAFGFFVQDSYKVLSNFTLELGFRYDDNLTPAEAINRFVVFVPGTGATGSLVQVGTGVDQIYHTNNKNFQPRVGFAWDPFKDGKTSVRGGYAIQYDQPVTNTVTGLTVNPPFATPISLTSSTNSITFSPPVGTTRPASVSPAAIDPNFNNAYAQSWNLNVQREITRSLGVTVGYFGSKGTHLRIARNINQFNPRTTARPFGSLSPSSPILPGVVLGNISQVSSDGNSSYNAAWFAANKRLSHGLQFDASYTFSKSIDYNSLSSQGIVVQDSFNVRNDRGLSDFDARHRFVISALYEFPFKGNRWVEGWQVSTITQLQSGNPLSIITTNTSFTGFAALRPDLVGSMQNLNDPSLWFINSVCDLRATNPCPAGTVFALPVSPTGAFHFGNLGRNVVIGPGFANADFSMTKTTRISETVRVEFRTEFFDLFNHPNFGQPGRIASIPTGNFGKVLSTRFPTGDSGSARQVQFALKLKW